jgi:DNA-binding HxlR family transcriptional regulator
MKKFSDYSDLNCPFHGLLSLLSGSWTCYILWLLQQQGELRFGALKKAMPGLSAKVLTERLRKLEEAGLVSRHPELTIPPKVTYKLTERGHQLQVPLNQLQSLASVWHLADNPDAQAVEVCSQAAKA